MSEHVQMRLERPEEMAQGVYADFTAVWHTADSFVLDFATLTAASQQGADEEGRPVQVNQATVVARVRIPQRQVFELMKALETQLSQWERENPR
ncbi:MAG: DUF3467 domain-containing protein [Micrococcales bacterium]|nr:DUF3467 domain-containing protein [Micrococcales bacterium]